MILIIGIPSEAPVALLINELECRKAKYLVWNQRDFMQTNISFTVNEKGNLSGILNYKDNDFPLEKFTAIYTRMTDWKSIPEIKKELTSVENNAHCERIHSLVCIWLELSSAKIINNHDDMLSNGSKPYQAYFVRNSGFKTPNTLITTSPETAYQFYTDCNQNVIYKSISGIRSIVNKLKKDDLAQLKKLHLCPTQFQQYVDGENVRVHVIDSETFDTQIVSQATDYRYAHQEGENDAQLKHIELPAYIKNRCINLSKNLNLYFSGIDLKISNNNEIYCFEVNPMPGYSYYENNSKQPISDKLAYHMLHL